MKNADIANKVDFVRLGKSLFKKNQSYALEQLPSFESRVVTMSLNRGMAADFNQLVGWQDSQFLAPTFLQTRALPLYLNMLSAPEFPFSPLGLVHLSNRIVMSQPLPADGDYTVYCQIGAYRQHRKGIVFEVELKGEWENNIVYEACAGFLAKLPPELQDSLPGTKDVTQFANDFYQQQVPWRLSSDVGRRYAAISGDYNLIHLCSPLARLFGFKRHIAHGMYLKARALSEVLATGVAAIQQFPMEVTLDFKKPVLLPAQITLGYTPEEDSLSFGLYQAATPHARGKISLSGLRD